MNRSECYIHPHVKETVKLTSNHYRTKPTSLTSSIIRWSAFVVVSVLRWSCVRGWLSRSKDVIYQGIRVIAETVLCSFFPHQVLMPKSSGLRLRLYDMYCHGFSAFETHVYVHLCKPTSQYESAYVMISSNLWYCIGIDGHDRVSQPFAGSWFEALLHYSQRLCVALSFHINTCV